MTRRPRFFKKKKEKPEPKGERFHVPIPRQINSDGKIHRKNRRRNASKVVQGMYGAMFQPGMKSGV